MATLWKNVAAKLGRSVRGVPRLLRGRTAGPQGSTATAPRPGPPSTGAGRKPVAKATGRKSTASAAGRQLVYAPQPDGQADPGEIVWTWVAYEDKPAEGKDRPVLVVGRERSTLLGLMLSSQHERDGQRHWLGLGPGAWDRDGRPSWVRLDRVLEVDEVGIRREGAVLDRARFDLVAKALRSDYGWR